MKIMIASKLEKYKKTIDSLKERFRPAFLQYKKLSTWFPAFLAIVFVLLGVFGNYLFSDNVGSSDTNGGVPLAFLLKGTEIVARQNGQKVVYLKGSTIEVSKDQKIITFYDIKDGIFFENGKPALHFQVSIAKWNRDTNDVDLYGGIKAFTDKGDSFTTEALNFHGSDHQIVAPRGVKLKVDNHLMDAPYFVGDTRLQILKLYGGVKIELAIDAETLKKLEGVGLKNSRVKMETQEITYDGVKKLFQAPRKVKLSQKDYLTVAERAEIDIQNRKASISGNVKISSPQVTLQSESITEFFDEEKIIFEPFVNLRINDLGKISDSSDIPDALKTGNIEATASKVELLMKDAKIHAIGSIKVQHTDKKITTDEMLYDQNTKSLSLKGSVQLNQSNARWLTDDNLSDSEKNDAHEYINEPLFIKADMMDINTKEDNYQAQGNIFIKQKEREAKGNMVVYNRRTEELTISGGVKINQGKGEWFSCEEAVFSLKKKNFKIQGKVDANFLWDLADKIF